MNFFMIYYQQNFLKQREPLNMLYRLSGTSEFKQSYVSFLRRWDYKYPLPHPVWPNIKYFPEILKTAAIIC